MTIEFNKHESLWGLLKKIGARSIAPSKEAFIEAYKDGAEKIGDIFGYRRGMLEMKWEQLERPYYNVYPAVISMLLNLKLDIPCSTLKDISVQPIEVRLPKEIDVPCLSWEGGRVKSLLIGLQPVVADKEGTELITGLVIAFDIGELGIDGSPVMSFKLFPLRSDLTIEEAINLLPPDTSSDIGVAIPQGIITAVVKLCACIALIDRDSDIITPDILVADKDKWNNASLESRLAIQEKAKRRGKNGWNIGSDIQHAPHYRRPHPAIVRIGKGRMLTRIVMRKGSVVHRNKLVEVPSGYEGCFDRKGD